MKFLKKLAWVFLFFYLIVIFLPKANLFYLAEEFLAKQKVSISKEKTRDILGFFSILDAKVYYDGLHLADVESANVFAGLLYNQVSLNDARFNKGFKQFVPRELESLKLTFTPFFPVRVFVSGYGDFGDISGFIDLFKSKLYLELEPKKGFVRRYPDLAHQFKKSKGGYIYEKTYK